MKKNPALSDFLTVSQVSAHLNISQSAAYALANSSDFPVCRLGRSIRIPRAPFEAWIERQTSIPKQLQIYMRNMKESV